MVDFHGAVAVATFTLTVLNVTATVRVTLATFAGHWQLPEWHPSLGVVSTTIFTSFLIAFGNTSHFFVSLVLGNHVFPKIKE
jgi:uncharacterized membrane protein (DUF2068 family)